MNKLVIGLTLLCVPFQIFSYLDDFFEVTQYADVYSYADHQINLICDDLVQYPKPLEEKNRIFLCGRLDAFVQIRDYCYNRMNDKSN